MATRSYDQPFPHQINIFCLRLASRRIFQRLGKLASLAEVIANVINVSSLASLFRSHPCCIPAPGVPVRNRLARHPFPCQLSFSPAWPMRRSGRSGAAKQLPMNAGWLPGHRAGPLPQANSDCSSCGTCDCDIFCAYSFYV